MVSKIAFTIAILALVGSLTSAQFVSPFPDDVGKADHITGLLGLLTIVSATVGLIAFLWGA